MVFLLALLELYNTYEHGEAYHHVAGCFLKNIRRIGRMSPEELAALCNVSKATITRFMRKLNFPTVSSLSRLVHTIEDGYLFEGDYLVGDVAERDVPGEYIDRLIGGAQALKRSIDPAAYERALDALAAARKVCFFAVPMNLDVFRLQADFFMAGKEASAYLNPDHQVEDIPLMGADSVAVFIHQRRQPDDYLNKVMEDMKKQRVFCAVIANERNLSLCDRADALFAFEGGRTEQDVMLCNIVLHTLGAGFRGRVLKK